MKEEECSRAAQHHPLHLLDDLLASLSSTEPISISQDNGSSAYQNSNSHHDNTKEKVDTDPLAIAEARQDLVLRAADDLFANNLTLLENALALLDEQEHQREYIKLNDSGASGNDDGMPPPVIRKIVAKRSGRSCVLVRKQRNKKSSNSSNNTKENDNTKKKKQCEMDEYYLCIMGRDTFDHHSLLCDNNSSGCCAKIQRKGAHCTCRSFSQNIKGGNSSSGRASFSPSVKSSGGDAASTTTATSIVICKHLLAAILMPFMLPWSKPDCGVQEEIVDDREFAKLVMRASIG